MRRTKVESDGAGERKRRKEKRGRAGQVGGMLKRGKPVSAAESAVYVGLARTRFELSGL